MASVRKLSAIRQLSLQCDSPKYQRNKTLKKQFSEDAPDEKLKKKQNIRVSLSAKSRTKSDHPPPIKLAWTESMQRSLDEQIFKKDEGVVAKKCKEVKRPATANLRRQSSLDKDSILCPRQKLAERLRQAWEDREKGRQNLDIFLNPKEQSSYDNAEAESGQENIQETEARKSSAPKIMLPLNHQTLEEHNLKSIFQKQIRKNHRARNAAAEFSYTPSRSNEKIRENTIVVVAVTETEPNRTPSPRKIKSDNLIAPQEDTAKRESNADTSTNKQNPLENHQPFNVIIRPATASSRREMFQKRTNSAFNDVLKKDGRPPLVRASSVPAKATVKPKFLSAKRRLKSGKKRDKADQLSDRSLSDDEKDSSERQNRKQLLQRCVSVSGSEIETMVSLVSPAGSDTEEVAEKEKEKDKQKCRGSSPVKTNLVKREERPEHRNFTLRKTVKSVSFQQSSIHAVRSFSASFPARRGSVATALMLGKNAQKDRTHPVSPTEESERAPKRQLLRTKSVPLVTSPVSSNIPLEEIAESKSEENISISIKEKRVSSDHENSPSQKEDAVAGSSEEQENSEQDFGNDKEKQCWEMYCKMSEKGVNVAFDTILRGMLTPTEYRMRRKPSIVATDASDNVDNAG